VLGQLYHCLQTRQTYDLIKAFGEPTTTTHQAAT
jgi:predicted nucleic acid-binding Zn ribbon protein